MTTDKLFDGSDAHLLPGNAELIQRLRTHACYTAFPKPIGEASDALEAADKRIAELEAAMVGWRADQKENIATAVEECKRANEAERKLTVARGALEKANHFHDYDDVLAQIGGDDASR